MTLQTIPTWIIESIFEPLFKLLDYIEKMKNQWSYDPDEQQPTDEEADEYINQMAEEKGYPKPVKITGFQQNTEEEWL